MVQKLSGFAKFDLDTKISAQQFYKLLLSVASANQTVYNVVKDENDFDQAVESVVYTLDEQKYAQVVAVFEKAFVDNIPPFLGDLENELYKQILLKIREFQPDAA